MELLQQLHAEADKYCQEFGANKVSVNISISSEHTYYHVLYWIEDNVISGLSFDTIQDAIERCRIDFKSKKQAA